MMNGLLINESLKKSTASLIMLKHRMQSHDPQYAYIMVLCPYMDSRVQMEEQCFINKCCLGA